MQSLGFDCLGFQNLGVNEILLLLQAFLLFTTKLIVLIFLKIFLTNYIWNSLRSAGLAFFYDFSANNLRYLLLLLLILVFFCFSTLLMAVSSILIAIDAGEASLSFLITFVCLQTTLFWTLTLARTENGLLTHPLFIYKLSGLMT